MGDRLPALRAALVVSVLAGAFLLVAPGASAPPLLSTIENPVAGHTRFGLSLATGDVNTDGFDDIAATAMDGTTNVVHLFDSSGSLIRTINGPPRPAVWSLAPRMADVDDDGSADIIIGSSHASQQKLWVYSGDDGSLIHVISNPAGTPVSSTFPSPIYAADFDSDGHADIAAADFFLELNDKAGQGRVYIFSGETGGLMRSIDSPNPDVGISEEAIYGPRFGSVMSLADATDDGVPDLLIAAPLEDVPAPTISNRGGNELFVSAVPPLRSTKVSPAASALSPCVDLPPDYICLAGRAYLFDGATGSLLRTFDDPTPLEVGLFGRTAVLADLDGDGTPEAVLAASNEAAVAYSVTESSAVRTMVLGVQHSAGDADGDGKQDLLQSSTTHDIVGSSSGRAFIEFGDTSKLLIPLTAPTPQSGAAFGNAVFGDLDNDGIDDLIIGAESEDIDYADQGRIYIMCACDDDTDGDGFASSVELHIGTESALDCHNNRALPDWPPDFDNTLTVTISDVLALKSVFGGSDWATIRRYDLVPSKTINVSDVLAMKPVFGQSCTP